MATVQCFEYVNPGGAGFKLAPDQQFYFTIGSNAAFANGAITVTAHPTSGDVPSGLYMEVIQTATRFMPTIGGPTYYLDVVVPEQLARQRAHALHHLRVHRVRERHHALTAHARGTTGSAAPRITVDNARPACRVTRRTSASGPAGGQARGGEASRWHYLSRPQCEQADFRCGGADIADLACRKYTAGQVSIPSDGTHYFSLGSSDVPARKSIRWRHHNRHGLCRGRHCSDPNIHMEVMQLGTQVEHRRPSTAAALC